MPAPPQPLTPPAGLGRAPRRARFRFAIAGALAAVLLGGCVVRVVYNQLDWLALWYVEDYFDLDPAQERLAREMIDRTIAWHRETQLPRYADLIRATLGGLQPPVQAGFVADRYAEVVTFWDDLMRQVAPDFSLLLQSLSDEQVEELFANLAEENRELEEDYSGIGRDERRAKQDKAILKAFRHFTGRLRPEQEVLVRTHASRFHDLSAEWIRRREAWQGEFRMLMAVRKSDPLFADRLTSLLLDPNQFDSPEYRQLVLENQQASFRLVAAVLGSLSQRQLEHFRKYLTTYADDFDALVRGGPGPAQDQVTGSNRHERKRHDEAA